MTLYLDTSSLLKLYVEEGGSDQIASLTGRASTVATSAVAYAEARAAVARRRRERVLTPRSAAQVIESLDADWASFARIEVTDALARRAGLLADQFGLRGFDAIHLASFELVLERADDQALFSSADAALSRAAGRLG